jgi:hypothetical protein
MYMPYKDPDKRRDYARKYHVEYYNKHKDERLEYRKSRRKADNVNWKKWKMKQDNVERKKQMRLGGIYKPKKVYRNLDQNYF